MNFLIGLRRITSLLVVKNWILLFLNHSDFVDRVLLAFENDLPSTIRINGKEGMNVTLNCSNKGGPKPKVTWLKGSESLNIDGTTVQLVDSNAR